MLSINKIYENLGGSKDKYSGITFDLTEGNKLEEQLNTPNLWGQDPSVTDYIPAGKNLTKAIEELLALAEKSIDISTLAPFPDGAFLEAINKGIKRAVEGGNSPVVRIMAGVYYPVLQPIDPIGDIERLIEGIDAPNHLSVYVGSMQTNIISWNHAKLIIVDGKKAIVGGHNQWAEDYTQFAPVHDLSFTLSGPAIASSEAFLNLVWTKIKEKNGSNGLGGYWGRLSTNGEITVDALDVIQSDKPEPTGTTQILSLAKLGAGLVEDNAVDGTSNASKLARIEAIKMTDNHLRVAQQMLGGSLIGFYDDDFLIAVSEHVSAGKEFSLIISDTDATTQSGGSYSGAGVDATAKKLAESIAKVSGKSGAELIALLSEKVHVAPLRFSDKQVEDPEAKSWMWKRDGKEIEPANHSKVHIFDEQGFYFGSDNAYAMPINNLGLQEFGFIVSGEEETKKFINEYWDKGWQYSKQFEFKDWSSIVD